VQFSTATNAQFSAGVDKGVCENLPRQRKSDLDQRTKAIPLIDDSQHPKRSVIDQLGVHKIHTPALLGTCGERNWATVQTHVLPTSNPHAQLQSVQAIEPVNPLLVHAPAFTPQQHVDARVPEPRPGVREFSNAQPQTELILRFALAVVRSAREPRQSAGSHRADLKTLPDPCRQTPPPGRLQSFFRTTSPKMCLSSVSPATTRE
jgi:hypothetical protein